MPFVVKDYYYQKAKKENFLARSVYKLEEIDAKYHVVKKGDVVMDMGYYPGSWVQYNAGKVGETGKVVGIDIQGVNKKLSSLKNVTLFEKDVYDVKDVRELGVEGKFDVLVSDMAPKTTGIKSVDQARQLGLVEMVFFLMPTFLKQNGNFVIKVFDSQMAQEYLKKQKNLFREFHYLKPKSTRSVSKEFFVIGIGYCGN